MHRYYILDSTTEHGFVELTEAEWLSLMGDDVTRPYAAQVYQGDIAMVDVPEDIREAVQDIVAAKVSRWGEYSERIISTDEALDIIVGGVGL